MGVDGTPSSREGTAVTPLSTQAEKQIVVTETHAKEQERIAYSLEAEMATFKNETVKQRKQIYQLEKERERYGVEAAEQRNLYTACLEEVKLRDMQIGQLQKEIGEWEGKLKQQQHLYEAVRSDRNLYSKNLLEAQDEIAEMKRKAKIQAHQLGQLKEEISGKDAALVKISFAHKKIDKQYETTRNEVSKMKKFISANEEIVHKQDAEIRRLASMIRRMDDDVRSRRPAVLRCLHAIDATRLHQTRVWVVSFLFLRSFGPSRVTVMLRAGPYTEKRVRFRD